MVVDNDARLRGQIVQKGFFTSTRKGFGKEDIYRFEKRQTYVPVDTTTPIETEEKEAVLITNNNLPMFHEQLKYTASLYRLLSSL